MKAIRAIILKKIFFIYLLVFYIYTTNKIVGNDVEAMCILFCCS